MTCPGCGASVVLDDILCPSCRHEPPCLEVLSGVPARVIPIWPGEVTLGRSRECEVLLNDRSISRCHARVSHADGRTLVEDLGGRNGVYVDARKVDRAELLPGAHLQLGAISMRFGVPAGELESTEGVNMSWLRALGRHAGTDARAALLALDSLEIGVVLVGPSGETMFQNRSARAILAEEDGLSLGPSGFRSPSATTSARLQALLAPRPGDTAHAGAVLVPRRSARRSLTVLVTPLGDGDTAPAVRAVFISDPERGVASASDMLSELYGLTPAETRVTDALLQGRSVEEAADALDISVYTARTHLSHVFSKTGTSRQSELVLLLLKGPGQVRRENR